MVGRRFIDLSVPISPRLKEPTPASIRYFSHAEGAMQASRILDIPASAFPDAKAWATEEVVLNTHTGTHVDAPWHYGERTDGKPARTIDEMPLEWFYGDGVLLDFTDRLPGYEFTVEDLKEKLQEMNYTLKPYDIVLIRCDADKKIYQKDYASIHVGASAEATRWLLEQGIKVVGTDGWGWDSPLDVQAKAYRSSGKPVWAAHFVGKEMEYCQIEKLANLEQIPVPFGFKVVCFPVKIEKASAGWVRPVAIIEED
ncbi:MAG: cyclase family protein [Thermoactinomyces sp.]